ncbi:hypothetical protein [Enterobacter kobei]|uniref:tail fiber/spike domain-containing protein n=1 Tax=Enterobacter kobei TaxID=208224 RepID=UPI002379B874|nr:hypothetical protein [Enterobacter kobei]MDD9221589.1 hypothetical protein [Enterobacter kobei]
MATTPTQNSVPSESPIDLKFNAGKIDEYVTSMGWTYTDRFGQKHYTIEGNNYLARQAISAFGYITLDSFEDGNTLTLPNQVLRLEASGEYYRWDGVFPSEGKIVPPSSTPNSTGGIGPGAWLSVGDAVLRSELASDVGTPLVSAHKVKLNPQGTLAEMQYYVTPEQFSHLVAGGEYVDENTDFTLAVQAAIDYAAANPGIYVCGTDKTYGVGKLTVTVGVKMIKSIKLRCVVASTDIVLGSLVDSGHDDLVIDGVSIDANSNVTKAAILMSGMRRSTIKNCRVFGNQVHGDLYGIRIGVLSSTSVNERNKILNNHVVMPVDPDNGRGSDAMVGISLTGIPSSTYGGLDINGGNPLWPSVLTIIDTVVSGNYIEGGTHGFAGGAVFRARITNNQIISNSHRNINLSGNCQRCLVANNHLLEAGSSAVNVAWGSRWMMVHNNYIQSSAAGAYSTDDAAIQMYKAVDSCSIVGNLVLGSWKYAVYLGSMVTNIDVSDNSLLSGSLANIAIESDWVNTSTYPLAIYSRNYDPTAVPVAGDSGNINIGGNTYAGACCAIYMVAVNSKALYNVNVHDEVIASAGSRPHIVYAYDAGTLMTDGALSNISARGASSSQYYLSRGRGAFVRVKDVTSLDDAAAEFSVSGSTPSAIFGPNIYIASGTVTNFTNAQNGDVLSVRMADGVVLVHNSSVMRLKGGVNATASGGFAILTLQRRAGIWFEMSRNF